MYRSSIRMALEKKKDVEESEGKSRVEKDGS